MPFLIIIGIAITYVLIKDAVKSGVKEAHEEQENRDKPENADR